METVINMFFFFNVNMVAISSFVLAFKSFMKYILHTINLTHLKFIIQRFLVY